jgi:cleavage and polyadenylation specificity factor subunit 1
MVFAKEKKDSKGARENKYRYRRMKRFDNVDGKYGVFLCGLRGIWLTCERGYPRWHPMDSEGNDITAFTPFHNINCPRGFIYNSQAIFS